MVLFDLQSSSSLTPEEVAIDRPGPGDVPRQPKVGNWVATKPLYNHEFLKIDERKCLSGTAEVADSFSHHMRHGLQPDDGEQAR